MIVELLIRQSASKFENEDFRIINATVLKVVSGDCNDKTITVKGTFPKLCKGEELYVKGTLEIHKKYGPQLQADNWKRPIPNNKEQLVKYFSSPVFKGIGKKTAIKIVEKLGVNAIQKISDNGESVFENISISESIKETITKTVRQTFLLNNVIEFYGNYAIDANKVIKAFAFCNDSDILLDNPYLFAKYRITNFELCDQIAFEKGMFPHAHERIETLLYLLLKEVTLNGDCYIEEKILLNKLYNILNRNQKDYNKVSYNSIINVLEQSRVCVVKDDKVYPINIYYAEMEFAKEINVRSNKSIKQCDDLTLAYFLMTNGESASDEQTQAVKVFLENNVMILTGGPGTGKTYTIDFIIKSAKDLLNIKSIGLAAPTGRAAKRISQSINENIQATTLHRMLGYGRNGLSEQPYYNKENKLPFDLVIIDEFSMIDIEMARNLIVALKEDAKLCIVGDYEQLESVGAGNVLKDLLETTLPKVELTKIFRQDQGSKIADSSQVIKKGMMINLTNENGQYFIPVKNKAYGIASIVKSVEKLVNQGYTLNEISVVTPMKKGYFGTEYLNERLRDTLNPSDKTKKEIELNKRIFRVGDKVMYTCNNSEIDVYNGDIGFIKKINDKKQIITIDFETKIVELKINEVKNLILAYATTIHKAQGSQSKVVILALVAEHDIMLRRNLIYTGVTRAEKMLVIVGEEESIRKAIYTVNSSKRKTTLAAQINKLKFISMDKVKFVS